VIQNFSAYKDVATIESLTYQQAKVDAEGNPLKDEKGAALQETLTTQTQSLPMGRLHRKKRLSNSAPTVGFSQCQSAHPYENPNAISNFLQMFALLLIPFALTYTFGHMVGDTRQGWRC